MSSLFERYEALVDEENAYYRKITSAKKCQEAIYNHVFQFGHALEKSIIEQLLLSIHQQEAQLRLDLLHVKIEQAFLSCKLNS